MKRVAAILLLLVGLLPARAEELAVGLTEDIIRITSSFTGAEIVMYGAIEAQDTFVDADKRDIIVVVRGVEGRATIRERARVAGIWVNADEVTFSRVPNFYYLASTAPLDEIAAPAVLVRNGLGLANLPIEGPNRPDVAEFEKALIRNKLASGLYGERIGAVQMDGPTLFQTRIRLPSNIPIGQYTAEAYLFRDGQAVAAYSATLEVDKSGIERTLFNLAHRNSALYGVAAILAAVLMGFIAALVFRERD